MEGHLKINTYSKLSLVVLLILLLPACSSIQQKPAPEPVAFTSEELQNGYILFNEYCNFCHPGGSSGLGPSIINKPLPKFMIRFQIRHGVGTMPQFKEDILQDEEVKNIAKYLVHLRKEN